MECPYCKNEKLVQLMPNDMNDNNNELSFAITLKNIKTNTFFPQMGIPVKIFVCNKCKNLTLKL